MSAATSVADQAFMAAALSLAARTLGDTWPNPAVGCVVVKDGVVVGRGWTQSGGRPHAETEALKRAGNAASGATAYVTLEPCSHHGKTPPCTDALIAAKVARVVAACTDPDPRVSGQGLAKLEAAGIAVELGVGKAEAERLNRGFFSRITKARPLFALKTATSLDGRIALANGDSKWITGPAARSVVQSLRARYDAILVGSGTVLADDPQLTCRLEGYDGRPKVRIILDRRLRMPFTAKVVTSAKEVPTWIVTSEVGPKAEELAARGVEIITADTADLATALGKTLAARGLTRVLIEGGGDVAGSFMKAELIDEMAWFRSPRVIGGDGFAAIGPLGASHLAAVPGFTRRETLIFGDDCLDLLAR